MEEAQIFEDELREANEQNSVLLARIKELEAQLTEETQASNCNDSLYSQSVHIQVYSGLNCLVTFSSATYKEQLVALSAVPGKPHVLRSIL
jgi:hypothetical protein